MFDLRAEPDSDRISPDIDPVRTSNSIRCGALVEVEVDSKVQCGIEAAQKATSKTRLAQYGSEVYKSQPWLQTCRHPHWHISTVAAYQSPTKRTTLTPSA